ncbi:MAG: cytochrome b [Alphaproteobacteria bacterium]|nr:cytochrome b [Rhodospirillales bacterium]MCW9044978.1 cytochrome b [Alphaproteobacteria bacterium]
MKTRNTENGYGLVAIGMHWVFALTFLGLFGLGFYMMDLGYYDPWYTKGPIVHESIGLLLAGLFLFRSYWRLSGVNPEPEKGLHSLEVWGAKIAHVALYLLPVIIFISGYLISSADGKAIPVFDWFSVPAILEPQKKMADTAGLVHKYVAYATVAIIALHAGGALKHHFLDKGETLRRMIFPEK